MKTPIPAVEWFRKAADKGHTFAMNWIGNAFWTGCGVAKNQAESVQWYRKTAELGSVDGQFAMGFALENGIGVLKNVDEAINWYRKAAAQDNAESIKALNRLGAKR